VLVVRADEVALVDLALAADVGDLDELVRQLAVAGDALLDAGGGGGAAIALRLEEEEVVVAILLPAGGGGTDVVDGS
jgi:hypothetical protein